VNGKLPDFKEEVKAAFKTEVRIGEDEDLTIISQSDGENLARKMFAEGMKHAAQRIIEDEGAHYDCWINEEADMVEKGKK